MKLKILLVSLVSLCLGFVVGFLIFGQNVIAIYDNRSTCPEKYSFINDQFDCEQKHSISKKEYEQLSHELTEYIDKERKDSRLTHVSIYFRDLVQGPTFGIDEKVQFAPASLVKVPIMLTYLSLAEKDNKLLTSKTSYEKVNNIVDQEIDGNNQIKPGVEYVIEELIERMIIHSDNLASGLLEKYLERRYPKEEVYLETLKQLGLVNPRNPIEPTFTVKSYSSLFRQLYNGSFLSLEMSERALEILSRSDYKEGLVAGVPKNLKVSHKFGEREIVELSVSQLHDCGIIYYPDNPYLLCIMTRGKNKTALVNAISAISKKVYSEVDSRRSER